MEVDLRYRPEVDGLRAFAVLSVVAYHGFPSLIPGGFVGVDIFFVISGFLISRIIIEELIKKQFSFKKFFIRRVKRIFPALLVVLTLSLVLGWFLLFADEYEQLAFHVFSGGLFFINFILAEEVSYFDDAAAAKPMLHLWSLAVEEQFYVLWPLILWVAWSLKRNIIVVIFLLALISFALNIFVIESRPAYAFFWPVGRLWELLVGGVIAYFTIVNKKPNTNKWDFGIKTYSLGRKFFTAIAYSNFIFLAGMAFLFFGVFGLDDTLKYPGLWACIPVIGTFLVITSGDNASLSAIFFKNKVAIWIGLVSYPLYLFHWPVLSFLEIVYGENLTFFMTVIAISFSILLAWITYEFIEKPIRCSKTIEHFYVCLLAPMILVLTSTYIIHISDGMPNRHSIVNYQANANELSRTPAKQKDCLDFLNLKETKFDYCRVTNIGAEKTVVVTGDSHAHAAYPGIAEALSKQNFNVLLIANSSCPPFIGAPWGDTLAKKTWCGMRTDQILSMIKQNKNYETIIFFSRGPVYWTGLEPYKNQRTSKTIRFDDYFAGFQRTLNFFNAEGRRVLYVTEVPELRHHPKACLPRPFNNTLAQRCNLKIDELKARRRGYTEKLAMLNHVTIIESLPVFCVDGEVCSPLDINSRMLYSDATHLSTIGSRLQFEKLLQPFFN